MNTIRIITTGRGKYREGLRGRIVSVAERDVFLGTPAAKVTLPEFTLEFDPLRPGDKPWRQEFALYGRDFVFEQPVTP